MTAALRDPEPVRLGAEPGPTLRHIARLRDSMTSGAPLPWSGDVVEPLNVDLLCHLPPPGDAGPRQDEWRHRWRPGLCYFRRGPGFVEIIDARRSSTFIRFVLDSPDLVDAFVTCLVPTSLSDVGDERRDAISALLDEHLLIELDQQVISLPHRMKTWPLPARYL